MSSSSGDGPPHQIPDISSSADDTAPNNPIHNPVHSLQVRNFVSGSTTSTMPATSGLAPVPLTTAPANFKVLPPNSFILQHQQQEPYTTIDPYLQQQQRPSYFHASFPPPPPVLPAGFPVYHHLYNFQFQQPRMTYAFDVGAEGNQATNHAFYQQNPTILLSTPPQMPLMNPAPALQQRNDPFQLQIPPPEQQANRTNKRNVTLSPVSVSLPIKVKEPRKCPVCHLTFSSHNQLNKHKQIHFGGIVKKPPFPCEFCDAQFSSKMGRNSHIRKLHENLGGDVGPYLCNFCGKRFPTFYRLSMHQSGLHREIIPKPKNVDSYADAAAVPSLPGPLDDN